MIIFSITIYNHSDLKFFKSEIQMIINYDDTNYNDLIDDWQWFTINNNHLQNHQHLFTTNYNDLIDEWQWFTINNNHLQNHQHLFTTNYNNLIDNWQWFKINYNQLQPITFN